MKVFVMTTLPPGVDAFEISGVYATYEDALAHCLNDRMAFIEFEVGADVSNVNNFRVYSLMHPKGIMT